jgi:hypothetical protein
MRERYIDKSYQSVCLIGGGMAADQGRTHMGKLNHNSEVHTHNTLSESDRKTGQDSTATPGFDPRALHGEATIRSVEQISMHTQT